MLAPSELAVPHFFDFESDMERSLALIPMAIRFKLDKCGIKLSLIQWNQFADGNKRSLLEAKCDSAAEIADYRHALCLLIKAATGDDPALTDEAVDQPWDDADLPEQVRKKTLDLGVAMPKTSKWRSLAPVQRFALIKLSRDGRPHEKFVPALREFGLL